MPSDRPGGRGLGRRWRLGRAGGPLGRAARRAPGSRRRGRDSGSSSAQPVRQLRRPEVPVDDALRRCRRRPQPLDAALEVRDRALLLERGGGGHGGGHPAGRAVLEHRHLEREEAASEGRPPALAAGPVADRVGAQQDDRLDGALLGQAQRLLGRRAAQAGGQAADLVGRAPACAGCRRPARGPRARARRRPARTSGRSRRSPRAGRPAPPPARRGPRRRRAARCARCRGRSRCAPRRGPAPAACRRRRP